MVFSVNITITSGRGDKHSEKSRHFSGHAIDLRTRHLSLTQINAWIDAIKEALGRDYDVIFEGNHIHVEYDPKGSHIHAYPTGQPYT